MTTLAAQSTTDSNHPPRPPDTALETDCIEIARQLKLVLEEEAEKLKRFAGAELLEVISRKEFLVGELSQKLGGLGKARDSTPAVPVPLRALLEKIDDLNRSNKHFILNSLSHWRDLLSILCPTGYGPAAEGRRGGAGPRKGLAFSREI